jgi:hypothetical protein
MISAAPLADMRSQVSPSGPELAAEITKAGLASQISPSSVLRILAEHPIKPW